MPTTLGQKYAVAWAGYPPHMSTEDEQIWKVAKPDLTKGALGIYYDVGLGGQTIVPPDTPPNLAGMWLRNTQKRVDVLLEFKAAWHIIELRHNASATAFGRIMQYRKLWEADPPDKRPVMLTIVTNRYDPDLEEMCKDFGIRYLVY